MAVRVFEGQAEIDISQYLQSLAQMDTETTKVAGNIQQNFAALDQFFKSTLGGLQTQVAGIAQQLTTVAAGLAGVTQQTKAAQQAQTQAQQQAVRAQQQGDQQQAQARQQASRRLLDDLRARGDAEVRAIQQQTRDMVQNLRRDNDAYNRHLQGFTTKTYESEKQAVQQTIAELRQAVQQHRQAIAQAMDGQASAKYEGSRNRSIGNDAAARVADRAYTEAVNAANKAAAQEQQAQAQLTAFIQRERNMQAKAGTEAYQRVLDRNDRLTAASSPMRGFLEGAAALEKKLVDLENRFNTVYRAGSQMAQVGQQMSFIGGAIIGTEVALTKNAGEFDFWARRVVAAMRAAGAPVQNTAGEMIADVNSMGDAILKLGRDLGVLKPAEVAKSWYLYQAAMGETIRTTQDLAFAQDTVHTILQAAIVTDTNYETAIRGTTQALAEFSIGQEGAAHAVQVMTNLTQTSQAEWSDVLEAFKMVGPMAHQLHMGIEEVSAAFARLSDYGIRGSMAGRAMQVALSRLIDPTKESNKVLNEIIVKNRGLKGSWQDLIFAGGEFVGMLDTINERGEIVQKGFLHQFAEGTAKMTQDQRAAAIAMAFSENATRALIPLVAEYSDNIISVAEAQGNVTKAQEAHNAAISKFGPNSAQATQALDRLKFAQNQLAVASGQSKKAMEDMEAEFRSVATMGSVFGDQWELVSESIKVRLGQAFYTIQEAAVRFGYLAAQVVLPWVEWLARGVRALTEFAAENEALAKTILGVGTVFAGLMVTLGPVLWALGNFIQSIVAIRTAWTTIVGAGGILSGVLTGIGASFAALMPYVAAFAAVAGVVYLAWRNNLFGIQELLGPLVAQFGNMFAGLADALGGLMAVLNGLISANGEQMRAGLEQMAIGFIEAFIVVPNQIVPMVADAFTAISEYVGGTLNWLMGALAVWGNNLMISLANGIYAGAQAVWDAAASVAEGIAMYFRSFSPPRFGPLRGIYLWGRNLMLTLQEGMQAADIRAVDDVATRIKDALLDNLEDGELSGSLLPFFQQAHELAGEFVKTLADGGRVGADFFAPMAASLGKWYDYVQKILLAYQEVYATERQLDAEKDKLDLLREQREELERQAEARQDAFDAILSVGAGDSWETNQDQMVDPTTDAGKAKIEEMREKLSPEDFQNWLNQQAQWWEAKDEAEARVLETQEQAQETAISALEKQLELVTAQYDAYVAMYEYALKLSNLEKEAEQAEDKAGGGGGGAKPPKDLTGDPEQLEKYRREIREVTGNDEVIKDEETLRNERGGDYHEAIGGAADQADRERERLEELQEANRRKRAEFEQQLINAGSEEERDRIKKEKDAWDAAYKEEQARLQERINDAKEVEDAAEKNREDTAEGRIDAMKPGFQEELNSEVQIGNDLIKDANQIKAENGELDQAAADAQKQVNREERELDDLRDYGREKREDFEDRIERARASGNEAEVSRIKEEQAAWEAVYNEKLKAQEEAVETAREAKETIDEQLQDERADEEEKAKKEKAKEPDPPGIGGVGGNPGSNLGPAPGIGAGLPPGLIGGPGGIVRPELAVPEVPEAPRETQLQAMKIFEDLKRGIAFLSDPAIDGKTKMEELGLAIADFLQPGAGDLIRQGRWRELFGIDDMEATITSAGTKISEWWSSFTDTLSQGWNDYVVVPVSGWWASFTESLSRGWNDYVVTPVAGFWNGLVERARSIWGDLTEFFSALWSGIQQSAQNAWNTVVDILTGFWNGLVTFFSPVIAAIGSFWSGVLEIVMAVFGFIGSVINLVVTTIWGVIQVVFGAILSFVLWVLDGLYVGATTIWGAISSYLSELWGTISTWASEKWGAISETISTVWNNLSTWASEKWGAISEKISTVWNNLVTWASEKWDAISEKISTVWGNLVTWASEKWDAISEKISTVWNNLVTWASEKWDAIQTKIAGVWDTIVTAVGTAYDTVTTTMGNIKDAIVNAINGAKERVDEITASIKGFLDRLASITWPKMPDWLGGGGEDGSHADGLYKVPFDGYRALLHSGERVLTAKEAAQYNSMEAQGVLNIASRIQGAVTGAANSVRVAYGGGSSTTNVTNNNSNAAETTKIVNVSVGKIDASNPSEGRDFLNKLAFFSS